MQKLHIFNKTYPLLQLGTLRTASFKTTALSASSILWQGLVFCFILFLGSGDLAAQQRTKIILQASEKSRTMVKQDITYLRKPVFRQDNAILTCDSAVFYSAKNYFEAYKNVHINQADTINIYSDLLTYDGNAKLAHLTSNVRLQDRTSTLTTNILDYSMGPKVGTYIDGGKIVNKEATITSKNGYYFANTRDAYFRYNVLVVTEQSTIKSDTLRYNTLTNWSYFYGPTNIKEKDGGNLYTENGAYNTKTRYAYFGKKNLYTSGSRSLKGDSLYYDGIAGYGKAVRNIVFRDTVDKMVMHGQLGFYYKKDQRTLVTKNAYAGLGTTDSIVVNDPKNAKDLKTGKVLTKTAADKELKEVKDTAAAKATPNITTVTKAVNAGKEITKTAVVKDTNETKDTLAAKTAKDITKVTKNTKEVKVVKEVKIPDSLWLGADTLETQMVLRKTLKLLTGPVIKKDNELGEEERDASTTLGKKTGAPGNNPAGKGAGPAKKPGAGGKDDKNPAKDGKKKPKGAKDDLLSTEAKDSISSVILPPWADKSVKRPDNFTLLSEPDKKAIALGDGLKIPAPLKTDSLKAKADTLKSKPDSLKSAANSKQTIKTGVNTGKKISAKDSLHTKPIDTVLTRIIKAYHHVKVFKTNMQAKADSLFYTSADSTLRWYSNPIMWAQGSQLTGDTIYLQLRNKKINSVQVIKNAFAVNVDADSAKFNQIKGKLITGFFKDGKLSTMYVDGNSETVYFTKTDDGKKYDKMNQTISSRIKILFKNSDISEVVPIKNVEGQSKPVAEIKEDVILTGFIWKPELRPRSKRDITNPRPVFIAKKGTGKAVAKGKIGAKPVTAKKPDATTKPAAGKGVNIPGGLLNSLPGIKQLPNSKQLLNTIDSLSKKIPASVIDSAVKAAPGILQKVDSVTQQPVILKKQ